VKVLYDYILNAFFCQGTKEAVGENVLYDLFTVFFSWYGVSKKKDNRGIQMKNWWIWVVAVFLVAGMQHPFLPAGAQSVNDMEVPADAGALSMLGSIVELKQHLSQRIAEKQQAIETSTSETEKNNLAAELDRLDKMLASANQDFERIATGIDISLFSERKEDPFDWKNELVSLIKPGIIELKQITQKARQKTDLKDELSVYQSLLPIARQANENLSDLIVRTDDERVKQGLVKLVPEWQGQEN
jgi:hypothetical protein